MRDRIGRTICSITGKHRYPDYFAARDAAETIARTTGEDHGRPYRCDACKGFHLGGNIERPSS